MSLTDIRTQLSDPRFKNLNSCIFGKFLREGSNLLYDFVTNGKKDFVLEFELNKFILLMLNFGMHSRISGLVSHKVLLWKIHKDRKYALLPGGWWGRDMGKGGRTNWRSRRQVSNRREELFTAAAENFHRYRAGTKCEKPFTNSSPKFNCQAHCTECLVLEGCDQFRNLPSGVVNVAQSLDLGTRPVRVSEGTRLLDFQITTPTLLKKIYYSIE